MLSSEFQDMVRAEFESEGSIDAKLNNIVAQINSDIFAPEERALALEQISRVQATLAQMRSLVSDPVEKDALERVFTTASLDFSADTLADQFAPVMASINNSSDLSEETKAKIQLEVFGTPRNFQDGTEILHTMTQLKRNGQRFLKDGQVVEFSEKNGVPAGRFTIYPSATNANDYVAKSEVGGRVFSFPFSPDSDPGQLTRVMKAAAVSNVLANRDFNKATAYVLGNDGLAAQGMTEVKLDMEQVTRAERLYGAFMGFGTELNTALPSPTELNEFERRLQATHIDGDAKTGDNTDRGDLSWQEIGMLGPNNQINMQKVEAVGAYINRAPTSLPTYDELVAEFGGSDTP